MTKYDLSYTISEFTNNCSLLQGTITLLQFPSRWIWTGPDHQRNRQINSGGIIGCRRSRKDRCCKDAACKGLNPEGERFWRMNAIPQTQTNYWKGYDISNISKKIHDWCVIWKKRDEALRFWRKPSIIWITGKNLKIDGIHLRLIGIYIRWQSLQTLSTKRKILAKIVRFLRKKRKKRSMLQ